MRRKWWKEAVVYQIYPRSFCDSNGDGVGDLSGIISKLDYLQYLGVDVVWLSPVYRSPGADNGYDISDYQDIAPEYGTLDDWREMLEEMHRRDIRLLMDWVINHTSDQHAWFQEARRSRDNPYRDYYIWRPSKGGREPNNWASCFGGPAWTLDPASGEYYLHLFTPQQPDLNWENPRVRDEIYRLMAWWLDQGVDGFRLDVINMISKVPGLPDAPITSDGPYQWAGQYFLHGPRLLEFLGEMKQRVLSRYDVFTVGETPGVTTEHAVDITHEEAGALNMLFQFEHVDSGNDPTHPLPGKWQMNRWQLLELKRVIGRWQKDLEGRGWNSFYLSNHDQPRGVSRFGNDGPFRIESAKMLATFLHLLHGTPYVYQGEEIGMTNVRFESIDDYRDVETLNFYREWVVERGAAPEEIMAAIYAMSRDNARTPMQWSPEHQAGFTSGTPWLRVNPNYQQINVAQEMADPDSILQYYRRLIRLRRAHPVIVYGRFELILEAHEQIFAFIRRFEHESWLVVLNFTADRPVFALPTNLDFPAAELLLSNYPVGLQDQVNGEYKLFTMRPFEARVYRRADG